MTRDFQKRRPCHVCYDCFGAPPANRPAAFRIPSAYQRHDPFSGAGRQPSDHCGGYRPAACRRSGDHRHRTGLCDPRTKWPAAPHRLYTLCRGDTGRARRHGGLRLYRGGRHRGAPGLRAAYRSPAPVQPSGRGSVHEAHGRGRPPVPAHRRRASAHPLLPGRDRL